MTNRFIKLLQVKKSVDRYNNIRDKILAYGNDKKYISTWFPGWNNVKRHFDRGGFAWSTISAPVNLDFNELLE